MLAPGALDGVRVLDLGGPTAAFGTRLLADFGADVIRVEPPGGDELRRRPPFARRGPRPGASLAAVLSNTNKRGVTLDLNTRTGRSLLTRLARTADALIETAEPGWMDSHGIGYPALSPLNPRLVYTAVTPFGQWGPHSSFRGGDLVGQATGGAMWLTGEPGGRPVRGGIHVAEKMAGYTAATATAFALFSRLSSGRGQFIDVSIQEAVAAQMESAAVGYAFEGRVLTRDGRRYPRTTCPASIYPASDGWVSIVCSPVHQWLALVDWMDDERLRDPRYHDAPTRFAARDAIDPIVAAWTATMPRKRLFHEGQRRGIPVGECLGPEEVVQDIHLLQRGYVVATEHPDLGAFQMPGPPFLMSGTPWQLKRRAPRPGEHNVEVFAEIGLSAADVEALHARGVM